MKKNSLISVGMILWLSAIIVFYYLTISNLAFTENKTDFYKFYLSIKSWQAGESPYWPAPPASDLAFKDCINLINKLDEGALQERWLKEKNCHHPNLNPPAFVAITAPLGKLDYPAAWLTWSILSISSGLAAIYLIFNEYDKNQRERELRLALIVAIFFTYFPTIASVFLGQVSLFLMLALTLGWRYLRNGHDYRTGLIIGLAAGLKIFVALFAIAFLFDGRWRACLAFLLGFLVSILIGGVSLGFHTYQDYISILSDVSWHASNWNASFSGFFYRIFGGANSPGFFNMPELSKIMITGSTIISLFAMHKAIVHVQKIEKNNIKIRSDFLFMITLICMLLLSPLGWAYYFPILFICIAIILHCSNKKNKNLALGCCLLFIASSTFPSYLRNSYYFYDTETWILTSSLYFYSLIILLTIGGGVFLAKKSTPADPAGFIH